MLEGSPRILTRRSALWIAASGIASFGRLYAGDFWDKKAPTEWDSEEIEKILHKSPWAKEVTAQIAPGEGGYGSGNPNGGGYPGGGGGMGGPRGGMGIPGIGGIGMPRGRNRGGGYPPRQAGSFEKGTVRWESAQPVLDAQKKPLPEAFANHYVISVSGIPLRDRRRNSQTSQTGDDDNRQSQQSQDDSLDNLKQLTSLEPKGKSMIQAGVVQRGTAEYSTFLFGFSKEMLQFTKHDNEVAFSTQLGSAVVKTKFYLKWMVYHKQLAV
ncbi:conserved exported hypothetical protein [Candidatus Sulfopaludibacter sp. SbA6]|nr:conserved exported hypothetical protein [Candidatus Sulfopaludibacter sp. SbA6]